MKTSVLLKVLKLLKIARLSVPVVVLALGVISIFKPGDPGGKPIPDDPVPT
ncbi:MAG: hypothetical protein ABWW65_03110 [Thermoprotei archaeon]